MTVKNTTMIGPKNTPTLAVPVRCTKNSVTRMRTVRAWTRRVLSKSGVTSTSPSSADSTEIAGVMIASPENSAAPATPRKNTRVERRPSAFCASAISESVPPSPLLFARNRNSTYLAVTVKNSAHRISETVPTTASPPKPRSLVWASDSRNAYSGLVPMSP